MNHEAADCPFDELAASLCRTGDDHDHEVKPEKVGTPRCPFAWRHQVKSRQIRLLGVALQRRSEP